MGIETVLFSANIILLLLCLFYLGRLNNAVELTYALTTSQRVLVFRKINNIAFSIIFLLVLKVISLYI